MARRGGGHHSGHGRAGARGGRLCGVERHEHVLCSSSSPTLRRVPERTTRTHERPHLPRHRRPRLHRSLGRRAPAGPRRPPGGLRPRQRAPSGSGPGGGRGPPARWASSRATSPIPPSSRRAMDEQRPARGAPRRTPGALLPRRSHGGGDRQRARHRQRLRTGGEARDRPRRLRPGRGGSTTRRRGPGRTGAGRGAGAPEHYGVYKLCNEGTRRRSPSSSTAPRASGCRRSSTTSAGTRG